MKKSIVILTLSVLLLAGCSHKPARMNQEAYDYGLKAIEIMDKYHAGDLNKDDCDERLDAIYAHLKNIDTEEGIDNLNVRLKIDRFQWELFYPDGDTYEAEDKLKKYLGVG